MPTKQPKHKLNDYYYRIRTWGGGEWDSWYTWREVCAYRKSRDIEIITKMLIEEYDRTIGKAEKEKMNKFLDNKGHEFGKGYPV